MNIEYVKKENAKNGIVYGFFSNHDFVVENGKIRKVKIADRKNAIKEKWPATNIFKKGFYLKYINTFDELQFIPMSFVIEFSDDQIKNIPEDKRLYQVLVRDPITKRKLCLHCTEKQSENYDVVKKVLIKTVSTYVDKYSHEICRDILHRDVNIEMAGKCCYF